MRKIKIVAMCALTFLAAAASLLDIYLQNRNTVNSGFVFINGKYVEAPYKLQICGNTVRLNDQIVYKKPNRTVKAVIPCDDFSVPAWVTPQTTCGELFEGNLPERKWAYLVKEKESSDDATRMIEYMRSLPCIASVEQEAGFCDCPLVLGLQFKNGEKMLAGFRNRQALFEPVEIRIPDEVGKQLSYIKDRLVNNGAIFVFRRHVSILLGEQSAARELPVVIEIMKSSMTRAEKLALVTKADLLFEPERLVDNFVPSKQLDDRLAAMVKKLGVKPMTLEELRAMPDLFQSETKPARPH